MSNQTQFVIAHLDDDPLELRRFKRALNTEHNVENIEFLTHSFVHSSDLLNFISTHSKIDFCILDIILSENEQRNGLSLIYTIKNCHPQCIVIVSSYNDESSWILKSLSLHADDFFSKKLWPNNIAARLLEVHRNVQIKFGRLNSNLLPSNRQNSNTGYSKSVGDTLKSIENRVQLILKSSARCVLIEGESGTGKEVVADIFEYYLNLEHTKKPFIRLNCASIAQGLFESELFGHKKGAFTGALQDKIGFIEAAHGGFLVLDEIASLSPEAQSALLRAIENHEIIRLGETQTRKINVRFLCLTNVPLNQMVANKLFRNDLWQRLCEIEIYLPPLSERKHEIPHMIDFFCNEFKEQNYTIDPLAKQLLSQLHWCNGNVRELRNTLRAMTEFAQNGVLGVKEIPTRLFTEMTQEPNCQKAQNVDENITLPLYSTTTGMFKYKKLCDDLLLKVVDHFIKKSGKLNTSKLAKELGLSRTMLHKKLKEFKLHFWKTQ